MSDAFNTVRDWRERGFTMRTPPLAIVSYDPAGDGDDNDAFVLVAREEHQKGERWDPDFAVLTAWRVLMAMKMPPGLEFPDKLAQLLRLHANLSAWANRRRISHHVFCVETNGVGYAMASTLRAKLGGRVLGYATVASSHDRTSEEKRLVMPRLAALDNLRVLAETQVLKIAPDAPGGRDLVKEMGSFVWRGPKRPEAMQGQRDDLVMALAGATWIGSKVIPPLLKALKFEAKKVH